VKEALVINTRSLEEQVVLNAIKNPFSFFGDTEVDSIQSERGPSLLSAISLPVTLVAYRSQQGFCSGVVKIKDKKKLIEYLVHHAYESRSEDGTYFRKGNRHIVLTESSVQICLGSQRPPSLELESVTYQKKGDKLFDALAASSSDIAYVGADQEGLQVDIEGNSILVSGIYEIDALLPSVASIEDESLGVLAARFDLDKLSNLIGPDALQQFSDFTKLEPDSLFAHWDGSISGALADFSMTQDTIVTYEYDADFNQIEVKEVKENMRPDFIIDMGIDSLGLDYMKRKKAVVEESGQQILAIMPLVTTYVKQEKVRLRFFTSGPDYNLQHTDLKLQTRLNLESIASEELPQFLSVIQSLDISIDNDNVIAGEIQMRGSRGALASLMGR